MKSLLLVFALLAAVSTANADIAKPKSQSKLALHTSLEIVPDATIYEAKLQISKSDFKDFRAAIDAGAGSSPIVAGIAFSGPRTIIAGLLLFMAVSVAGVMIARSSFGRAQKTIGAVLVLATVLGAAAIITRGNVGPPPSWRWRNLPQALAEGKPTIGGVDVEIVPDDQLSGRMRLLIPLKTASTPGEE